MKNYSSICYYGQQVQSAKIKPSKHVLLGKFVKFSAHMCFHFLITVCLQIRPLSKLINIEHKICQLTIRLKIFAKHYSFEIHNSFHIFTGSSCLCVRHVQIGCVGWNQRMTQHSRGRKTLQMGTMSRYQEEMWDHPALR